MLLLCLPTFPLLSGTLVIVTVYNIALNIMIHLHGVYVEKMCSIMECQNYLFANIINFSFQVKLARSFTRH